MAALMVRPSATYDEQGRNYYERVCQLCGRTMWVTRASTKFCTRACQMRAWRAASMLAGTHGWQRRGPGHHDWTFHRLSV